MDVTAYLEPGEVAELTGLSLDTLRYYEREGLVGPIERRSGQRRYSHDDVAWIGLVTCLRTAGLGIADLRRFTDLLRGGEHDVDGRVAFLQHRRAELVERLATTEAAINVLDDKIAHYSEAAGEPDAVLTSVNQNAVPHVEPPPGHPRHVSPSKIVAGRRFP